MFVVVLWYCFFVLYVWEFEYKRGEGMGRGRKGFNNKKSGGGDFLE